MMSIKIFIYIMCTAFFIASYGCGKNDKHGSNTDSTRVSKKEPIKELPLIPGKEELRLDSIDYVIISSAVSQYLYPPVEFKGRADFFAPPGTPPRLNAEIILSDSTRFTPPPQSVIERHNRLDPTDVFITERLIPLNAPGYILDSGKIFSELTVKVKPEKLVKKDKILTGKIYSEFPNGIIYVSKPSRDRNNSRAVVYFRVEGKNTMKQGLIWLRNQVHVWGYYDIVKYDK